MQASRRFWGAVIIVLDDDQDSQAEYSQYPHPRAIPPSAIWPFYGEGP